MFGNLARLLFRSARRTAGRPTARLRRLALLPAALALVGISVQPLRGDATRPEPPATTPEGIADAVLRVAGLEGRVLWMDGTANLERLSTRAGVAAVMERCARARINTVVVDVKPLSGHVLYDSKIAPRLREWRGFRYPPGFDLLRVALEEGHARGLRVYAAINVFSDGHKLARSGPIYDKPDEQSVIYDVQRFVTTPRGATRGTAIGVNRTPGPDQLAVYDAEYGAPRTIQPDEAFALVLSDRVEAVGDAALAPGRGLRIPRDGCLLVGRGESARWLLQNVRVGDLLTWNAAAQLIPIVDAPSEPVAAFMNPANPKSREYLLKIVEEIATGYPVDGIVFDRMRYASLQSDFSELSRRRFEEYIGRPLHRFPEEIYQFDPNPARPILWGPYFRQWLEWRARNIRTWLEAAAALVRAKRPGARVAVYVGSWYDRYYSVGVNWASEEFAPGYDWMSAEYPRTGYAGLLDWVTTGCYHPVATREQAKAAGLDESATVQAAAELSTRAVGDVAFVYAGLYLRDYRGSPEAFREALRAARRYSHGVMLFDLMHLEEFGWWPIVEEEFREPRRAPHDVPGLLAGVRSLREALGAANRGPAPVIRVESLPPGSGQ